MAVFSYVAVDAAGKRSRGMVESDSPRGAREQLRAQGLTPVALETTRGRGNDALRKLRAQLPAAEQALFCRLIGSLLEAGLDLSEALDSAARQAGPRARPLYIAVRAEIAQGKDLSQALDDVLGDSSSIPVAAVAAGERSGQLAQVLLAAAENADTRAALRSQILAALLYPALLSVVALAVAVGLVTYVVPEVARVYEGFEQDLPWLTVALIGIATLLRDSGLALILIAVLLGGGAVLWSRSRAGRQLLDAGLLKLPFASHLLLMAERERFLSTLGMLTNGGVPLVDALLGSAAVMRNSVLREAVMRVAQAVERGQRLDEALTASGIMSPVCLQLLAAGVDSARLAPMAFRSAQMEREALQRRLTLLLGTLEPVMILLMGGFVLLIVLAILLPVFELNSLVG